MIHLIWNATERNILAVCDRPNDDVKKEITIKNSVISNHVNCLCFAFETEFHPKSKWLTWARVRARAQSISISIQFKSTFFSRTTKLWKWMLFNWRIYVFKMSHNLTFKFNSLAVGLCAIRTSFFSFFLVLLLLSLSHDELNAHILVFRFWSLHMTRMDIGHETNEVSWKQN